MRAFDASSKHVGGVEAEEHVRKYGAEDITQYRACFDAQVQGQTHAAAGLDMMPDPRAASMHHKEARRQLVVGQASTSADPATVIEMDTEDVEEAPDLE